MDGTKIMVLKLGEIVKTLIFAILGIAVILLVIYFFVPKQKEEEPALSFNPGTYSATVALNYGDIDLEVTVTEDSITAMEIKNLTQNHELIYPLLMPTFEQITNEVLLSQTLEIMLPTDSAFTGEVLLSAVETALAQAMVTE